MAGSVAVTAPAHLRFPTVSLRWRRAFFVEVPICVGTAAYWLLAPGDYVARAYGVAAADVAHAGALRQLAFVLATLLGWTYGRWLLSGLVELRPFRYLQEGLALGDALIIAGAASAAARGEMAPGLAAGQMAPAALWLAVRAAFLWRTRG